MDLHQLWIGLVVASFGALITAVVSLLKSIRAMELQLNTVSTQMSPLWAQVQARIAAELHHPHPRYKEMDKLLERLETKPSTITNGERVRLKELLSLRAVDTHPDITPQ